MYCKKCGTENRDDSKFCKVCGTPLGTSEHMAEKSGKKGKRHVWKFLMAVFVVCVLAVGIGRGVVLIRQKIREKQYGELTANAEKYLEALDYEKAETDYLQAIDIDPKQKEPYEKLILIYQETAQTEKLLDILQQGVEKTEDKDLKIQYSLYNYVDHVLIPEIGQCGTGPFACSYKKTSSSCLIDSVHSEQGVITTKIADFDQDGQLELLAAVLDNQTAGTGLTNGFTNSVMLQMYEYEESGVVRTAEYKAFTQALGVGSVENDWIFFKTCDGIQYICGNRFQLLQVTGDGLEAEMFAVSYKDERFVETFSTEKMGTEVIDDPKKVIEILNDMGGFSRTVQWLENREKHWGYPVNYVYHPADENDGTFLLITGEGEIGGLDLTSGLSDDDSRKIKEYYETGNPDYLGKQWVQIYIGEYHETEFSQWLETFMEDKKEEDSEASGTIQSSVTEAEVTFYREDRSLKDSQGDVVILYYFDQAVLENSEMYKQFSEINRLIQQDCEQFFSENGTMDDWYESVPDERKQELKECPYLCIATGNITCNQNGILSICLLEEWCMGGVYNTNYSGESFNLETGERLRIEELFSMGEQETLEYLKNQTKTYVQNHPENNWTSEIDEIIDDYVLDQFEFYVEEGIVNLCYRTYELGPGAMGPVVVPCPIV